jgi:hypothetical protein
LTVDIMLASSCRVVDLLARPSDLRQDLPRLGRHAAAVAGGTQAERAMDLIGRVADAERGHAGDVGGAGMAVSSGTQSVPGYAPPSSSRFCPVM